jgi:hypothetical protein
MDTASWRVMLPASFAAFMNSWISASQLSLRNWPREKFMCQASLLGYQGSGLGGSTTSPSSCSAERVAQHSCCQGGEAVG